MPKKTRQDKIIAQLKRQLATQTPETNTFSSPIKSEEKKENNKFTYTLNAVSSTPLKTLGVDSITATSTVLIKKDLTKTLILTILVISFELVLYSVLR
jgi:hypothetical protein